MDLELEDKRAIVTSGSRGIGLAIMLSIVYDRTAVAEIIRVFTSLL